MVRLTDLLKKVSKQMGSKEEQAKETPPPIKKEQPSSEVESIKPKPPKDTEKERPPEKEKPRKESAFAFSEMLLKEEKESVLEKEDITGSLLAASLPSEEETKRLYLEAVRAARRIFRDYKENSTINWDEVKDIANKIVNNVMSGSSVLLELFHRIDSLRLHLFHNAVNVSILAVRIGMIYKYNKSTLLDVAISGLLHDVDLIKILEVINSPKKLDKEELEEVRKHPVNAANLVKDVTRLENGILKAIQQHHERKNGQGYPLGLTEKDTYDLAFILGIADTYEAMTHYRPYKEKMSSHSAILELIELGKDLFPNKPIKALVACVGLYPVGSWVELNTGEICKVLTSSPDFPLRPVVTVLMDRERNKLEEIKTIDLRKTPSLHITRPIENITKFK